MRFWDSSAVVPLLVREARTPKASALLDADSEMLVWWATEIECVSAIARLEREGALATRAATLAIGRLTRLASIWHEVLPSAPLRAAAARLLRVHELRAADALQIAAAITGAEGRPPALEFVCVDERLRQAAEREGFAVVPRDA